MNSNPFRTFTLSFINMAAGQAFGLLEYGHTVTASNRVVQCVSQAGAKRSVVGNYRQMVLGEYSLALADLKSLRGMISQNPTQHLTLTEVLQALNTCFGNESTTSNALIVPFCLNDQVLLLEVVQIKNAFFFHLVDDGVDKCQDVIRFATSPPGRFRLFHV